ncbi:ATP-binding protein [Variovorax sp. W6]|uniref:ATP-binding protein n=1 Tax=Variovorax sp. W6 TaxID=3093895 RepID=UPI003D804CDA
MTIFIAGVHGVGKTYLAKQATLRLGLKYATASQLIREERGHTSWNSSKQVDEVAANQAALVAAVTRIKADKQALVLDGHLVLRKDVGQHLRLPDSVFHDLGCTSIILLACPTPVVLERLVARGDNSWDEAEMASFARAEAEHAAFVASSLRIRLIELKSPSIDEFDEALKQVL